MAYGHNQTTYQVRRVVEYSGFFKGEPPIDICSELKRFNRTSLIRTATILSLHYGNYSIPDGKRSLFSESSKKYVPYLNKMFKAFFEREKMAQGEKVEVLTYKFESFLLGQTATPIHRLGFGFKMLRDSFGIRSHSIPTTPLLIVNNMYLFPHIHYC